ncbi:MAG TPA: DNA polymerase I [Terriglobia bacterium]|nr:DNA polymerase I [Terriglobia bacterium]
MAETQHGKKLVLIDAMSLVFRAFHAPMQMELRSPAGMPTKAIYIFVRTLRKILKDHPPDFVGVAFDLAAPTFRDKLFEEYKANRPAFPEELAIQLPYVRRFCRALGLTLVEKEGYEADDVMGTLAEGAAAQGTDVFIVSGDEDLFQLVKERVKVLKPSRGTSDSETLCDVEKVKEILGVEPSQVVDWLALTGDPSDNIPGARPFPGHEPPVLPGGKKRSYIGPKGATELMRKFGTLDKALENYAQEEKQSYREALRDFCKEALLSRELATIRADVPLEVGPTDLKPTPVDSSELRALCQELGFTSLLREFLEEAPAPAQAAAEVEELQTPESVKQWLTGLDERAPVAIGLAVEGEESFSGQLGSLALSDGRRLASVSAAPGLLDAMKSFLSSASHAKAVHNSKLLRLLLGKSGASLAGVTDDTMLYSYLLDPLASSQALEDIVLRRQGRKLSSSVADWADATRQLATLFVPEIAREELKRVYEEIELPLSGVLADVEAFGIRLDAQVLACMSAEFDKELTDLTLEIYDLAGQPFDIDSPKQLGEILFEKLKLPGGKRLKKSGQYSTDAAVLESLAEKHALPRKIIDYRTRTKLKSTYLDALPKFINPQTGRLHTTFSQTVARTGRLSSFNPNLQNIPIGDEFGQRIRSAFVADPGCRLISADYSQVELRVLAHLADDPVLIEAFMLGEDIHARTAVEIFGVPPALQTHEHRRTAKAINYGVVYGLSSFGLAERTGTSKTEAQLYIDTYFLRYSKVKELLDRLVEEARTTGRVRTLFGRLRPIPEINSRDVPARNRAEREAMNSPIQGTAADLMKLAMIKVHTRLEREEMQTRMLLTVHDELVFEAPEAELERAREIIKAEMESAYPLKVPLRVDIGVGQNWKEAK